MEKMNKFSVSLTPRDLTLLQNLYDKTVLSFDQIWQKSFNGLSISTVSNRLSKLEKASLIKSFNVPKLDLPLKKHGVCVLFQITKDGIRELQKRNFSEVLRAEPIRLHGYCIEHDVILTDVMEALERRLVGSKVIHGKIMHDDQKASGVHPDAIVVTDGGDTYYAVELELTLKSESRYQETLLKYRLASEFEHVIYVISHPAIRQKIAKVLAASPQTVGGDPITGKFFFVNLKDLLRSPIQAVISNGNDLLRKEVCA